MITEITDNNFNEALEADIPVIIDFYSDTCTMCRFFANTVEEIARNYAGKLRVFKCNAGSDDTQDIVSKFGIRNLPTVVFLKEGEQEGMLHGAIPTKRFELEVKDFLNINP